MKKDISKGAKLAIYIFLFLICLICIIPIITVISISFSSDLQIAKEGYGILPKGFTLDAYKYVFKDASAIFRSYGVTIVVTLMGLVLGLLLNSLIAYVLSRRDYAYRKQLTIFLIIPMVLNGGLVPTYIWMTKYLHMKNTIWAMLLPLLIVPWFIILLRTFFSEIPSSLMEAATVDGAGELTIFFKIVLPLAKPALATVGMFITLNYWNDWFQPLMYIDNRDVQFAVSTVYPYERCPGNAEEFGNIRNGYEHCGYADRIHAYGNVRNCSRPYAYGIPVLPEVLCKRSYCGRRKGLILLYFVRESNKECNNSYI